MTEAPTDAYVQSRRYSSPPIQEGLVQFMFAAPAPWNLASPGVIWTALKEQYPRDPEQQVQVGVSMDVAQVSGSQQFTGSTRYIFSSDDSSRAVLASPANLSTHAVGDYRDWSELRARMAWAARRVDEHGLLPPISSVSVHYINRINLGNTTEPFDLSDFFNINYTTPLSTRGSVSNVALRTEGVVPDEPSTVVNLIFASAGHDTQDDSQATTSFILDIEFIRSSESPWDVDRALAVADRLKTLENQEFENAITDTLRSRFE